MMKHSYCLIFLLLTLIALAFAPVAYGASFVYGLDISTQSLDVDNPDNLDTLGTLSEDLNYFPFISFATDDRQIGNSAGWSYHWAFDFGGFRLTEQEIDGQMYDLGTSARGYYGYIAPTFAYNFGDVSGAEVTAGIGLGLGYLMVDGDIVLTESSSPRRVDISGEGFGYAVGVYLRSEFDGFVLAIRNYAPVVYVAGYDLMLHNISISLGQKIEF